MIIILSNVGVYKNEHTCYDYYPTENLNILNKVHDMISTIKVHCHIAIKHPKRFQTENLFQ